MQAKSTLRPQGHMRFPCIGEGAVSKQIGSRFSKGQVREAVADIKESELHLKLMQRAANRISLSFPDKKSEPRLRSVKMLTAISAVKPTLNAKALANLEKPSHAKALREGVKKGEIDIDKQLTLIDEVQKQAGGGKITRRGIADVVSGSSLNRKMQSDETVDELAEAMALVTEAAEMFCDAAIKYCDMSGASEEVVTLTLRETARCLKRRFNDRRLELTSIGSE